MLFVCQTPNLSMNKLAILLGISVAVIASGTLAAYAFYETDMQIDPQQDVREIVSDIKEDVDDAELGYGQVEKQEGAYSP